jgi:hypothetical protein
MVFLILADLYFPKLPADVLGNNWFREASWNDVALYNRKLTQSFPGVVIEVPYESASNRTWAYHVADSAFLRAWLAHPG